MGHWSYPQHHRGRHWVTGLILIGIGTVFLLDRLGYIEGIAVGHFWPFILAILGVARMLEGRSAKHVAKGGFMVFLGFWLFASIEHLWGLTFQTSWPMVLIALGLTHMVRGLSGRADQDHEGNQP
jgi:hypothetical protein